MISSDIHVTILHSHFLPLPPLCSSAHLLQVPLLLAITLPCCFLTSVPYLWFSSVIPPFPKSPSPASPASFCISAPERVHPIPCSCPQPSLSLNCSLSGSVPVLFLCRVFPKVNHCGSCCRSNSLMKDRDLVRNYWLRPWFSHHAVSAWFHSVLSCFSPFNRYLFAY